MSRILLNMLSLIEKFNTATLLKSEWTHEAHLTVALWYIQTYELNDAVCRLKSGIILLNHFHGTENTNRSGYHETLTIFWANVIWMYCKLNVEKSKEEITEGFLNSALASRELPFKFYLKREILSSDFRTVYHEPTLKKINFSVIETILNV